jgi:hypothetical protein
MNLSLLLIILHIAVLVALVLVVRRGSNNPSVVETPDPEPVVPFYDQRLPVIEAELARARRHRRPLCVVVLRPYPSADSSHPDHDSKRAQEEQLRCLGPLLKYETRTYDFVAYDPERLQYVILLAEANRSQAQFFAQRITRLVFQRADVSLSTGIAEFPYAGLVIEDLICQANESCQPPAHKKPGPAAMSDLWG